MYIGPNLVYYGFTESHTTTETTNMTNIKINALNLFLSYSNGKRTGQFPCAITKADGTEVLWIARKTGRVALISASGDEVGAYNDDGDIPIRD